MRQLVPILKDWLAQGHRFALGTVTQTWGSSPRPIGSTIVVRDDGLSIGSVSGGCVETLVKQTALEVLSGGYPKLLEFENVEEGQVWEVGLSCGGKIHVWVDLGLPFSAVAVEREIWDLLLDCIERRQPAILVRSISSDPRIIGLFDPCGFSLSNFDDPTNEIAETAIRSYNAHQSGEVEIGPVPCFVHLFPSPERLIIVGAVHIAEPLVAFATAIGFETVVIDPRENSVSGLSPNALIHQWPAEAMENLNLNANDYCVALTHDPKIDDQGLIAFLGSQVRYVGALGSRKSHAQRLERLAAAGVSEQQLTRIHGPIGLPIGAKTAPEIALSIIAEIVKVRHSE